MFEKFVPDIYVKSIYYINYEKLYKNGVRCLIFDLDNTITPYHVKVPTKRQKKLFDELKDIGFKIIIMSNAPKNKVEPFKNFLLVDACYFSLKPKKDKYLQIMDTFKYKNNEIACIGDQLLTDVWGANRVDLTSILVNPLTSKDNGVTLLNRLIEKIIYSNLSKKDLLKKGRYYE